jgi:phospholipid/cholesterol/gamma-HCH transport system substrate-binding protein
MKKKDVVDKVKLGFFVLAGLFVFAVFVFYIGSSNYKLGASRKKISVIFNNVTGLRHGSIVRFSGVNIGTIEDVNIVSDSSVEVTLVIETKSSEFIKKDSKAKISTEGMLGNRFVSITPGSEKSPAIQDGDRLQSIEPLDFDKVLSNFSETGNNAKNITSNLDNITKKIDRGEGTLGTLISDKEILNKAEKMLYSFQTAGDKTAQLTLKMTEVADSLKTVSNKAIQVSENLIVFTNKLNNDSSSLGKAINDTAMAKKMDRALTEVSATAVDLKLTSEKIRSNWFVRHFSKKPEKQKNANQDNIQNASKNSNKNNKNKKIAEK